MQERVNILNNQLAKVIQAIPATGQPAGPGRDMTFVEKRKLSMQLARLQGVPDMLKQVLDTVAADPLFASSSSSESEVEVELDQLKADTLWKLHALVASKPAPSAGTAAPSRPAVLPTVQANGIAEKKPPVRAANSTLSGEQQEGVLNPRRVGYDCYHRVRVLRLVILLDTCRCWFRL